MELLGETRLGRAAHIEARLLRARALLKLLRPADVIDELRPDDLAPGATTDERITAAMLHGAAVARLDVERGIALLADVARTASRERAHSSVLAEIAYFRAVAHWGARDLLAAERLAQHAERRGRDVLAVRATQLRGFIAAARDADTRYADALALFRTAARRYARCTERDVSLASIIVEQIATLEKTLRSATERGSHDMPRARALPGAFFGAAVKSATRVRVAYNDAWLFALDGNDVVAFRTIAEAEAVAPSPAWTVRARVARAVIAAVSGERAAARTFADAAAELASEVDWTRTVEEEHFAFLELAETFAYLGNARRASAALTRFYRVHAPMDNTHSLRDADADPRLAGWIAHVRGVVSRVQGDSDVAASALGAAAERFRSCGYLWREALSLIELDATRSPAASGEHLDRAVALVRENFPRSFLARRLGGWARAATDSAFATLTPAEREVLRHMLDGRTQKEIAEATGRAYNTVRTQVQSLHRKLGTSSDVQIVILCARRGIVAPRDVFGDAPDLETSGRTLA
ncbi:MAG: response regulator transcription factor [Candidatus Eremiobacteraeota bacterium]|nr:response regulator transcription factor [Candidatus Eremiobacteraeota bacterium]